MSHHETRRRLGREGTTMADTMSASCPTPLPAKHKGEETGGRQEGSVGQGESIQKKEQRGMLAGIKGDHEGRRPTQTTCLTKMKGFLLPSFLL